MPWARRGGGKVAGMIRIPGTFGWKTIAAIVLVVIGFALLVMVYPDAPSGIPGGGE